MKKKFKIREDFNPDKLYALDGEIVCGDCIREYFGLWTDAGLQTAYPVTDGMCMNHNIGCVRE